MLSPAEAFQRIFEGNKRFISGNPAHPRQESEHRMDIAEGQYPFAALFGCSDSRLAAEIIFDVGLGDLFVVRNAGHVIAETILGSLEYSVEVLKVPLIVVLGHDSCGAIEATIKSSKGHFESSGEFINKLIARIAPTLAASGTGDSVNPEEVTDLHVSNTIDELISRSNLISEAIRSGKLAVVGATYKLALGQVTPIVTAGKIN